MQYHHPLDPAFVIVGIVNAMNERFRARVVRIKFPAGQSSTHHYNVPISEVGKVPHTIELVQRALRVDDYGTDILGAGQKEESRLLAGVTPDMFANLLNHMLSVIDAMPYTERVLGYRVRDKKHRPREMEILDGYHEWSVNHFWGFPIRLGLH